MKTKSIALIAIAAAALGQSAAADDTMGQGHMMMGPSMSMMSQMHDRMQSMQSQMNRIHATRDHREQAQLMNEHMRSMQGAMQMMGRMQPPGAQTDTQDAVPMHRCTDDSQQCRQMNQMIDRQEHMQQRMDMMQMMMQQMLEHEAVGEQNASK